MSWQRPAEIARWSLALALASLAACDSPTKPAPPRVASVHATPASIVLERDSSAQITIAMFDSAGMALAARPATWASGNAAVARVSATGLVTGIAAGTTTVTATSEGRAASVSVTVLSQGISQVANVLDSTRVRLIPDSVSAAAGVFTFDTANAGGVGAIARGQVIVGTQGGGFLRRVTDVTSSGTRLTVRTTPAALTDVVRSGGFRGTTHVSLTGPTAGAMSHHSPSGRITWQAPQIAAAAGPVTIRNGEILLNDVELYNDGAGTSLKFADGRVKFEPDFSIDFDVNGGAVNRLEASATGTLSFDGNYQLQLARYATGLSGEARLFGITQPFFTYIGVPPFGIPVVGTLSLDFTATANLQATGQASVQTGFLSSGNLKVGARYQRHASPEWDLLNSTTASFTAAPVVATAAIGASAGIGLKAELRLSLYRVAGPYMFAKANAGVSRTIDLPAQMQRDRCTASVDAGVGFDVQILSYALVRFEKEAPLYAGTFCSADVPLVPRVALSGRVYDAVTNAGLGNATVTARQGSAAVSSVQTNAQGAYVLQLPDNSTYDITAAVSGYVPSTINALRVSGASTAPPIPLVPNSTQPGGITGRVLNATTGGALAGATLELRRGINATQGAPIATTLSNAQGAYTFAGLAAGTYSIAAVANTFVASTRTGIAVGGSTVPNQDVALSPIGVASAVRVVLTWGASPLDVDSHLTGPIPGSASRFHVYWNATGNCAAPPYACLDVDDMWSYGPETVTITQLFTGTYRYSVHNYSAMGDGGSSTDRTLAASGARVDVYVNNLLRATFSVPQAPGTLWTVFTMDQAGIITPVNTMSGFAPAIGARVAGLTESISDADVIMEENRRKSP